MTTDELITKLTAIGDANFWELIVRINSPTSYHVRLESYDYNDVDWEAWGSGSTLHEALDNCYQMYTEVFDKGE